MVNKFKEKETNTKSTKKSRRKMSPSLVETQLANTHSQMDEKDLSKEHFGDHKF